MQVEIDDGVVFWGLEDGRELVGVMGIQKVQDVTLIRHAYVRSEWQKGGIGAQLLGHLRGLTEDPILIGTWAADGVWASRFYEKHGFRMVGLAEEDRPTKKILEDIRTPERNVCSAGRLEVAGNGRLNRLRFVIRVSHISNECFLLPVDFVSHNNIGPLIKLPLLETGGQGLYEAACADLRVNRRVAGSPAEVDGVPVPGN